jgi:hypothetical protein
MTLPSAVAGCLAFFVLSSPAEEEPGPAQGAGDRTVRTSRTASGPVAKANEELLALQEEIRKIRAGADETRRSQAERLKQLAQEKRMADRAIEHLGAQKAKKEKENTEKKAKLASEESALAKLKEPSAAIVQSMRRFLDEVEAMVDAGIPWKVEQRKTSIAQARESVSGANPNPSAALAAAARIALEEEALARLVESSVVEIDTGKERLAVQAFHLGLLAVIFANEDGTVLGFAEAGRKLEDGLDAARGNPDAARGYLVAVDILRRRRTPSLVDLYLPSIRTAETASPVEGGKEAE